MLNKFNPANPFYEWGTMIDGYFVRHFHGIIYVDDVELDFYGPENLMNRRLTRILTQILKEKYIEMGGVI